MEFFGCGRWEPSGKSGVCFRITKLKDIEKTIVPFFNIYPLWGAKLQDLLAFQRIVQIMINKAHLKPEGLNEIKAIKPTADREK